ncbi:hypothetical protein [Pantoea piersonii]|jgi:CTP-dependent riboflavin kinase|uniref:hypothetical protein n=1 Tax=Pantoea piersonii TaxID=2364647 RepID=UPI000EA20D07|nr:hypothetical protein [Pantoea piersonii]MBZ6385157.1 hypothetical protein [Pantoea piersonii]MBZ6385233.1 hypothetical protein [Pantoea piersonii]MBZ6398685.1 hypothetical protein [Pantoea piersonii]MBZ6398761.1 hypothetical protein [Pantoea piersonii]MBZ6406615.1 hypothetical protein [Pantoea piersonii]
MKIFACLLLIISGASAAQKLDTSAIITACSTVPRLYSVASLAAFDSDDGQWRKSTYQVASELMIGNKEADRIIDSLRNNKDIARRFASSGAGQAGPEFMNDCITEPSKYIPSYERLLRAGKLTSH